MLAFSVKSAYLSSDYSLEGERMDTASFYDIFKKKGLLAKPDIAQLSKITGIPKVHLKYYLSQNKFPVGTDLCNILNQLNLSERKFRLKVGVPTIADKFFFLEHKGEKLNYKLDREVNNLSPVFESPYGKLFNLDCIDLLRNLEDCSIDLIFADPPFNISKLYPSRINDSLPETQYLQWCEEWILELIRILKFGGSLFIWNLPKWNFRLSSIINEYITFRNWISVEFISTLPIKSRLYPAHYSLLYFVKGERTNCFKPDRLEIKTCKKCFSEINDYGGYKSKMNSKGVNLSDVWDDISPVRHHKYKKRNGSNELPLKLIDRIIEMSSNINDIVLDPFGGSGTTYVVAELKKRRWIGSEIGPIDVIVDRFKNISEEKKYLSELRKYYNRLFSEKVSKMRKSRGLWLPEDFSVNSSVRADCQTHPLFNSKNIERN